MKLTTRGPKTAQAIADRQTFTTSGALSATYSDWPAKGELPRDYAAQLSGDIRENGAPAYIVFSYRTPIAWWTKVNGWVIPPVKYSRTTSAHQGVLYLAHAQKRVDNN